jgi:hypothetical protein
MLGGQPFSTNGLKPYLKLSWNMEVFRLIFINAHMLNLKLNWENAVVNFPA